MGRRIYINLKKAIRYIISIHIPIVLMVLVPLALGWIFPNIFTPVHVIFLELIMGPTCSIIYENEPMEANAMQIPPREATDSFFTRPELLTSVLQGLVITAGLIALYWFGVTQKMGEHSTRSLVYLGIISANVALTLVNRSFYFSVITTLRNKNNLITLIICCTVVFSALILTVPFLAKIFSFGPLSFKQASLGIGLGLISVLWFEGVKFYRRQKGQKKTD